MAAEAAAVKMITLKSSDGEKFVVEKKVAMESQTIKHIVEDDCTDSGIPVPNVTSKILAKVIEYCKKYVEAKAHEDDETVQDDIKTGSPTSIRKPSSTS